jgi:muramoyltetrapeptide carboxypeptidase
MSAAAANKIFMGYSDTGFLLAGLAARGVGKPVHGPMPSDIRRDRGEAAIVRSLAWLADPTPAERPQLAFNVTVLSHLLGTPLEPDFTDRVLMLEEIDEHHYALDRALFQITSTAAVQRCAGIMLGRCGVKENDRPFFADAAGDEESIVQHWCALAGIDYLGRANIGHDVENAVVPFA